MRILYIDIDSLRPDHLGCYGYHRNTSPTIDRIARAGLVLERCYTPDAPCLPSRTAFYSGRFGIQTGVVGHGMTAAQPKLTGVNRGFRDEFGNTSLAAKLQQLGYHTAMISPFGQRHAAWHFYAGFNEIHNTGKNGQESAEEVQPLVEQWLAENAAKDNWFLHINYWDPHTHYRVPMAYGDPFATEPLPEWLRDGTVLARHLGDTGPHSPLDFNMYDEEAPARYPRSVGAIRTPDDLRKVIDGYDTAVRYVDDQVARVVALLEAAGVYEETMVVISADHGENFGELGIFGEHGTADEATCHVPMIIKYPGGVQGARDRALRHHFDLAPTLLDLLGCPAPKNWDAQSFTPLLRGEPDAGRENLVLSQCCHVAQRSVRWDRWLYIRTYHAGFHDFGDEMLFDLVADPHEANDLAGGRPDLCREGAWRLARWHDAQMQRMAAGGVDVTDPLWTVIREGGPFHANLHPNRSGNPENGPEGFLRYLGRLEATGRGEGAQALREKFAACLPPAPRG